MQSPRTFFARHAESALVGLGAVGALVLLGHLGRLWALPGESGPPTSPIGLVRYLEVPLAWVPSLAACGLGAFSHDAARGTADRERRRIRRVTAVIGATLVVAYLAGIRLPALREGWSRSRLLTEMGGLASSTSFELPLVALAVLLGLAGLSVVIGGAVERSVSVVFERSSRTGALPWARRVGLTFTAIAFLVGSSALLRYATGSPWPMAGSGPRSISPPTSLHASMLFPRSVRGFEPGPAEQQRLALQSRRAGERPSGRPAPPT